MARYLMAYDSLTGRLKRTTLEDTDVGGFIEAVYEVSGPSATEFPAPSGATIEEGNLVEFARNGQDLFEGATNDFQRDVGNNKVITNYAIPQGSRVKLRVYAG